MEESKGGLKDKSKGGLASKRKGCKGSPAYNRKEGLAASGGLGLHRRGVKAMPSPEPHSCLRIGRWRLAAPSGERDPQGRQSGGACPTAPRPLPW